MNNLLPMEIEEETGGTVAEVQRMAIVDQLSYNNAASFLRQVKTMQAKVRDFFGDAIDAAHKAHKAALAQRDQLAGPLDKAERALKSKMTAWIEAEAQRVEEERQAAIDRQRVEDDAERQRQEDAKVEQAAALERAGHFGAASAVLDSEIILPPTTAFDNLPSMPTQADGISFREVLEIESVDKGALISAVAAGQAPSALLSVDMVALRKMAGAYGEDFAVPGVVTRKARVIAARRV